MSGSILERRADAFNDYIQSKADHSCVMRPNTETAVWLATHNEYATVAGAVATALVKAFDDGKDNEVNVSIMEDPDAGSEKLLFEVKTSMPGRDARARMRRFVQESMPTEARSLRDGMIFSIATR
jgi:hypothetical protein